ncbi:MAG: SPOR domain-containing protein [Burkholderiales bacterium]|nr:SPOR domain-containing protein [Burkholderiales bacterium]
MQRGGFAIGVVVGLLSGLVLALGVALYIAKVPVPFVNKVPGRTTEQDNAEAERNRSWDPNAPLGGRAARGAAGASASGVVVPAPGTAPILPPPPGIVPAPAEAPATATAPPSRAASGAAPRDPAAILSGAPVPQAAASPPQRSTALGGEPFVFFVQAGAYTRSEDAEQQRAKLALMGQVANVSEREQSGRTVYRVRVGPFRTREEADALLVKFQAAAIDAQIVRVERP